MMLGPQMRTCQRNGSWSGKEPSCRRVCPLLANIRNGFVESKSRYVLSVATYGCNHGYILKGSVSRTCQDSGNWSGTEPLCRLCDNIEDPVKGKVNYSRRLIGAKARYSCMAGFSLNGTSLRICQESGDWSGSEPTCTEIKCSNLPNITNGHLAVQGNLVGDKVVYKCLTDYTLEGSEERVCQSSGQWSGTQPSCFRYTTVANGEIKLNLESGSGHYSGYSIGGAVVLLVIILVPIVIALAIIIYFKKRKKQVENSSIEVFCNGDLALDNMCYGAVKESNIGYAEYGAKASVCNEVYMSPSSDEEIYSVPPFEEEALYSKLENDMMQYLQRSSVKLESRLGSGQFGEVFKGKWQSSSSLVEVAIKTLKEGAGEEDRVKFLQEAAIMGQFKNPNVVTMYGVVTAGEPILLVLELLPNGDLRNFLLKLKSQSTIVEGNIIDCHALLSYCCQVASGMVYLSSKHFIHRDLAARNILVSSEGICKIADFGMSRDLLYDSFYTSRGGMIPVKWTAPEALHYKKYSTSSDVWSYGVLMHEIWSVGHKPFEEITNNKVMRVVDSGYRLPPPPGCPRKIYSLMIDCWHPNPSNRPPFKAVKDVLSESDSSLLLWLKEDSAGHPEAQHIGGNLQAGADLFMDLQNTYITSTLVSQFEHF